ncbi:alpha-ketoglutarate-dependent dioxygenase AlkB [Marinobacteraceae bacterium S3BR75-40.1]
MVTVYDDIHPELRLICPLLPADEADALLTHCLETLPWRQESIQLFGRRRPVPRLQCWMGDPEAHYRYSGLDLTPLPWTPALAKLRDRVAEQCGQPFNSVLCNLYRDGQDSMGWHSDDEPELGAAPLIASVSLGAERRFQFRPRSTKRGPINVPLPHNSLLIMPPGLQTDWQHGLPKTRKPVGPRINFTFRRVQSSWCRASPR